MTPGIPYHDSGLLSLGSSGFLGSSGAASLSSSSSVSGDMMLAENPWLISPPNNVLLILSHETTGERRAYIQMRNGELDYLPSITHILNG
jgi:hypothetical protein